MTGHKCSVFRFSNVEVHEGELRLKRAGQFLSVEPKSFGVLVHLLRNPGRLIPKNELLNAGWAETAVTENSLTRNIAILRRLLDDDARAPRYIETMSTVGTGLFVQWNHLKCYPRIRSRRIRRRVGFAQPVVVLESPFGVDQLGGQSPDQLVPLRFQRRSRFTPEW